jgi:hypothetical protein
LPCVGQMEGKRALQPKQLEKMTFYLQTTCAVQQHGDFCCLETEMRLCHIQASIGVSLHLPPALQGCCIHCPCWEGVWDKPAGC